MALLKSHSQAAQRALRRGPRGLGAAVTGACLLLTALATVVAQRDARSEAQARLESAADQLELELHERMESYELLIRGAAGLFAGSEEVSRAEWRDFVAQLDADTIVPGMQGIGYAARVRDGDVAALELAVRGEGFTEFAVHPTGQRDEHAVVLYLEPLSGRNLRAFGYDMWSETVRRAALADAMDSGEPGLTGRLTLQQETRAEVQPGVILLMPVYRTDAATTTPSERRQALIGWTYIPLRMTDFMEGLFADVRPVGFAVRLHEGRGATRESLLYDELAGDPRDGDALPPFRGAVRTLRIEGQEWTLALEPVPGSDPVDTSGVWLTLLVGLVATAMIHLLLRSWRTAGARAVGMAEELTRDLRERDAALQVSEHRWKFAVEGAGDGLWDWDVAAGTVWFSHQWKAMLGLQDDDISNRLEEWSSRIHPDDLGHTMETVDRHLRGESPTYQCEHRVRCKDGSYLWILDRGMVVERDAAGHPLRMIGTHKDISSEKRLEAELLRRTADLESSVQRMESVSDLYKALSQCNAALVRADDEASLFAALCRIVARQSGVAMAWIGTVDESARRVVPVAWSGDGVEYLDGLEVSTDPDDPHGRGPTGSAARDGVAIWFDDFAGDERTSPWHERGSLYGWASSAALPLRRNGKVVAVLTLYSRARQWLDTDTKALLGGMATDISYALDKLALTAAYEEAEQRFRSLVEQSIAGAYIIQDEVLVYANPRFKEILGYSPDADLDGMNARELFLPDELDGALERQRMLLEGGVDSTTANVRLRRSDGGTVHVGTHSRLATYHQRPAIIGLMQNLADPKVAEAHIERYVAQLEQVMRQTVGVITDLSEMRDPYTAGHERSVAQLAVDIGRRLHLDETRLEGLRIGGLLHDVGKIAVPSDILVKPSRLTDLEMAMVREHAAVGFALLHGIDFPWPVARIAHEHHERFDGTGYPCGLRGEQICLEARIVSVADVIDSMASHRPYRPALGVEAALAEIRTNRGTLYDPVVVDAAIEVLMERTVL